MVLGKFLDPDPKGVEERHVAAIEKWRRVELLNAKSNLRLFWRDNISFGGGVLSERVLDVAKRTIRKVIGDEPELDVLYGTFTNGASTSMRKRAGVVADKFKVGADVTAPCLARFRQIVETCETWKHYREGFTAFNVVRGGALFTVPKNNEIDRCAVKEPDLNMFIQKGIGAFIRKRLKSRLRVDLNDQTHNQRLARLGSVDGSLATLDLSSASDTVCEGLVRVLLPEAWFDLLNDCRSQAVSYKGEWIELNMFSSMGNAFTFELESLIFWAIANAVCYCSGSRGHISVYGDDIIVPSGAAGLLAKVLQFLGFKVNTKKSFWTGRFRESCGKHWYRGCDVTPFFVRKRIDHVEDLIQLLNQWRAWSTSTMYTSRCYSDHYPFWEKWSRMVPRALLGGRDTARKDALVSSHNPRKKLWWNTRDRRLDDLGAYLYWLRSADGRSGPILEPLVTSSVTDTLKSCVLRRSSADRRVEHPTWDEEFHNGILTPSY
jgi:hypothetical protein